MLLTSGLRYLDFLTCGVVTNLPYVYRDYPLLIPNFIFTLFDCLPLQKNTTIYSDCNDNAKQWVCIICMQQYNCIRSIGHGLHSQKLRERYLTLLVDVWKLAHMEWIRWALPFGPPFLHKNCHKKYIHNDQMIQHAKQGNMLVQDSQGNIWKTNSCMCCRTAVSSFNNLLLSIKPASLHFGNAHLLNSKPTKLELSLNGNGIFSITLAKEIDGKSIQQMKS